MRKKWRSWLLLAVPYLLTALVPVISVLFLGNTILRNYQDKAIADKQSSIEVSFERMLQKMDTAENLSYILSGNDILVRYSYACVNRSGHNPLEFMELKDLFTTAMTNPLIYDIFLFDTTDNCVVSADSAMSNMSVFFRYSYMVEGYSVPESIDRLKNMPKEYRYCPTVTVTLSEIQGATKDIVEYRLFLPVGWIRDMQSQLIIAMDAEELFSDFADTLDSGGEFYVYNSSDALIYGSGTLYEDLLTLKDSDRIREMETEDGSVYGAVLRSRDGAWKVKVYMPELPEGGSFSFLSPAVWGFVISPVIISVLFTILFTHKNYRGIIELLEMFRGHMGSQEKAQERKENVDYRLVQEYAGKVIEEKNRATQRISEYEFSRKYEVLDKLVRSTYRSREEAARALAETDLNIRSSWNVVLCIRYAGVSKEITVSEDTALRASVRQVLGGLLGQRFELFDASAKETVCVISMDEGENLELLVQNIVSNLNVEIAYHYGIEVLIGAGSPAQSIDRLGDSYEQAKAVIRYRELSGNHVNLYSELVQLEDLYFYPKEFDEKILDYVVAGKKEEAIRIIQKIYEENFVKNSALLSVRAIGAIKNRLWGCVVSIGEKYGVSLEALGTEDHGQSIQRILGELNAKKYFELICEKIDLLAEKIQEKKSTVQNSLVKRIMEYVHENFCDSELSLKQISTAVGVHENYISNLFKNVCGENLSAYIENLRIEKACDLIGNTAMKIEEIAEAVGYTSSASFRRAFKKVKGVSPVEYRER